MKTRILTHLLPITKTSGIYPFTIDIPNDVLQVIGIALGNDAFVNVGAARYGQGDGVTNQIINYFKNAVLQTQKRYNKDNKLIGSIPYPVPSALPDSPDSIGYINLNQYQLGNIGLTSYEKCGQFFNGAINPKVFKLNVSWQPTAEGAPVQSGSQKFILKSFEDKKAIWTPVNVDGITTEIHGIFEPTVIGKKVDANTHTGLYDSQNDYVLPYNVRIYLLCQLK